MNKLGTFLPVALVSLVILTAAGPALVALSNAVVPAVLAVGLVVAVLRLVWHYTSRY